MLCPLSAAYTLVALLAAGEPATAARHACRTVPSDSAAETMILDEMRAFYRDLDDRNWTAMITHFLPAKVTARWAPPATSSVWAGLEAPSPAPSPALGRAASASGGCAPRAAVAIVGDWARVRVRRCADPVDEAWLLRVSDHWKIVHLALATPPAV